jgi:acetamidase/formamidase
MRTTAAVVLALCLSTPALAQNVVRYEPKEADLKYVFGVAKPVATVKPGDIIDTRTFDCFGNVIQKPGDTLAKVKGDNPLTGPFYVEGAEPGDTLAVKILELAVDSNQGVGALAPGFGALNTTSYTPMLHAPVPEKIWFYAIDRAKNEATFSALDSKFTTRIPLHPFLGCLGVAPAANEARSTIVPGPFGGNMDCWEVRAGNTVFLGVNVPGAMLSFGDGHYAMGEGEIIGTAVEGAMNVELYVELVKSATTPVPRIENADEVMFVASGRPLEDAARVAFKAMVGWVRGRTRLGEMDAFQFVSQNARSPIVQLVDPEYTVLVKLDKRRLPRQ